MGKKNIELCNNWVRSVRAAWEDQRSATGPDGWGNSVLLLACWCSIKRATGCHLFQCACKILCLNVSLWMLIREGIWTVSTLHALFSVWEFQLIFLNGSAEFSMQVFFCLAQLARGPRRIAATWRLLFLTLIFISNYNRLYFFRQRGMGFVDLP